MLPELVGFSKWLRRRSPHSSTYRHYTNDVALFFDWVGKPPPEVSVRDVDLYVEHCLRLGRATATVNRRLASIRSFYSFLEFDSTDPPPNPVRPKRHAIRQGRRLPRDVDHASLARLFSVISSPRDRAMYILMLRCGLRVGEVHNLSLGDVDISRGAGRLDRLWLRGKTGAQRVVFLSPQALQSLRKWLDIRRVVRDRAVFVGRGGRRLSVRTIQHHLSRYCRQAGVRVTCHQLRHTFGHHLVEAGMPVTSIRRLLGHERLRTTQLYIRVSDQKLKEDYQAAIAYVDAELSAEGGAACSDT
jgi:site-specific recombinase XerD